MKKLLLALVIVSTVGCSTTRNVNNYQTPIPPTLTKKDVEKVIISGALKSPTKKERSAGQEIAEAALSALISGYSNNNPWKYESRSNDVIYAGYNVRSHYMRVAIDYSGTYVTYDIVDSKNLDQEDGYIHENALIWLGRLDDRVRYALGFYDRYKYEHEL